MSIQDWFIFELEYKTKNQSLIRIFDLRFVYRNKDYCIIIYNGKEYELTEYFELDNNNNHNN